MHFFSVKCQGNEINTNHAAENLKVLVTRGIRNRNLQSEQDPLLELHALPNAVPRITCQTVKMERKRFYCDVAISDVCFQLTYPSSPSLSDARFISVRLYG